MAPAPTPAPADDSLVRAATPDDVPAIQRIAHAGWRASYGDFLPADVLEHVREEWHDRETIGRSVERDDVKYFVACEPDADGTEHVVGYASGGFPADAEHPVVGTLYVDPDRWGEGYGSALFDRVLAALRERGADRVRIHVFEENDVGRAFYESRGFDVSDRTNDEIAGESVDVVVYESEC